MSRAQLQPEISFSDETAKEFIEAVKDRTRVSGLTHSFYNYPARFSPQFARAAIELFTNIGDTVLDPFMGGGTTLVESRVLGRQSLGLDISGLAAFISKVKTTCLSKRDIRYILEWSDSLPEQINLRRQSKRPKEWIDQGYQRNINTQETWPIRKSLELSLLYAQVLPNGRTRDFVRCALLKTGQWALDCKKEIPTVKQFRIKLRQDIIDMTGSMNEFSALVRQADSLYKPLSGPRTAGLERSAIGMEHDRIVSTLPAPKLIVTSPPYPGAHVLYHRWQIKGRRETPAPFWIADTLDGTGEAFYTMGNRYEQGLASYFDQITKVFSSISKICDNETIIVQLLAFPEPKWQLKKYLECLGGSGFSEIHANSLGLSSSGKRIWREVPSRKWYVSQKNSISTSKEVVLFHRLSK